jgi:hypothetical protein
VRANGVTLRYQLSGKGTDTIVLLHEAGMALERWDYVAPELAETHRGPAHALHHGDCQGYRTTGQCKDVTHTILQCLGRMQLARLGASTRPYFSISDIRDQGLG